MIKSKPRRAGAIRVLHNESANPHLKDIAINHVHVEAEMNFLTQMRQGVFHKYEAIIRDLKQIIATLETQNFCLARDRRELQQENHKLKNEIAHRNDLNYTKFGRNQQRQPIFQIINEDEQKISRVPNLANNRLSRRESNEVMEQSSFQINTKGHYFEQAPSMSLSDEVVLSEGVRTPIVKKLQTTVQVTATSSDSIIRLFYLCLLQSPIFVNPLIDKMAKVEREDVDLLPLLGERATWYELIKRFVAQIIEGEFYDEEQVLEYIQNNPIIDLLLVSLLKKFLPYEEEDNSFAEELECQSNHRILQGLCNQFDFELVDNSAKGVFKIFVNRDEQRNDDAADKLSKSGHSIRETPRLGIISEGKQVRKSDDLDHLDHFINNKTSRHLEGSVSDSRSDSMLLDQSKDSHYGSKEQFVAVDISLRPNNNIQSNIIAPSAHRDPEIQIYYDRDRTNYRANITIRVQNFGRGSLSFNPTEQEEPSPSQFESLPDENSQPSFPASNIKVNRPRRRDSRTEGSEVLMERDMNARYGNVGGEYLMPQGSRDTSQICSMSGFE